MSRERTIRKHRFERSLLIITLLFATLPNVASALSCPPPEPRQALASAHAALVGTVVSGSDDVYTLDVERWVKGGSGEQVTVLFAGSEWGGGFDAQPGDRLGLILHVTDEGTIVGGCTPVLSPDALLAAAEPVPSPSEGDIAILTANGSPPAPIRALAGDGSLLGYGLGADRVAALSVCPGSVRSVEIAATDGKDRVLIRDLATLEVTGELAVLKRPASEIQCRDADASDVVVRGSEGVEVLPSGRVVRVPFKATVGALAGQYAVFGEAGTARLRAVDLETERWGTIYEMPVPAGEEFVARIEALSVAPDGSRIALAGPLYARGGEPSLHGAVIDLSGQEPTVANEMFSLEDPRLAWVDDDTLALAALDASSHTRLMRALDVVSLSEIGAPIAWDADTVAGADGTVYGTLASMIVAAPVLAGPAETVQVLEAGWGGPIVAVADGPVLQDVARQVPDFPRLEVVPPVTELPAPRSSGGVPRVAWGILLAGVLVATLTLGLARMRARPR